MPPSVAKVPEIAVAAVNLLLGHCDRHVVYFRVGQRILPRADVPLAPRGDHLQLRVQRLEGQLKAHLIVPLAGATVGHGVRPLQLGDLHLPLGNQRARERRPQQVLAFVDRTGLHRREDVLRDKLLAHVFHIDLAGAAGQRLFAQTLQLLVTLPQVRAKGDHLAAVIFPQPGHNHRGIQPAGIGKHRFLDFLFHNTLLSCYGNRGVAFFWPLTADRRWLTVILLQTLHCDPLFSYSADGPHGCRRPRKGRD